jgi:hypothetical protein
MKLIGIFTLLACSVSSGQTLAIPGIDGSRENATILEAKTGTKSSGKQVLVFAGDNVIPQIVNGDGWSSAITLVNLENRRLQATILFFADDGRDLILPIVGQGRVRGMQVTLDPTVTLTFQTDGLGPLSQGWAYIQKENGASLGGMAVFKQRVSGRPDFEAVVPVVNQFGSRFVLLYDNTDGFSSAMALANPGLSSVSVPALVRSENGEILDRGLITLGGYNHRAQTVQSAFPVTAGRRGTVEFLATGNGVGVLGLRFNPGGSFTSVHVLSNASWILP